MNYIQLTPIDLSIAAILVLLLAATSRWLQLGLSKQIVIAAVRCTIQLLLVGWILRLVFDHVDLIWIIIIFVVMLLAAGREVWARQQKSYQHINHFYIGTSALLISSFSVLLITLFIIIQPVPWYQPQYAIPLLGIVLGNAMNGTSISTDRFLSLLHHQRDIIEQRLMLGQNKNQVTASLQKESFRAGMITSINAMVAAGIISLPGAMTGQILAGIPPLQAVKYQILIMFILTTATVSALL